MKAGMFTVVIQGLASGIFKLWQLIKQHTIHIIDKGTEYGAIQNKSEGYNKNYPSKRLV